MDRIPVDARVVLITLIVALAMLWSSGRMDPALSSIGLNKTDCVQNGFGATYCGEVGRQMLIEQLRASGDCGYNDDGQWGCLEGRWHDEP